MGLVRHREVTAALGSQRGSGSPVLRPAAADRCPSIGTVGETGAVCSAGWCGVLPGCCVVFLTGGHWKTPCNRGHTKGEWTRKTQPGLWGLRLCWPWLQGSRFS